MRLPGWLNKSLQNVRGQNKRIQVKKIVENNPRLVSPLLVLVAEQRDDSEISSWQNFLTGSHIGSIVRCLPLDAVLG